MSLADENYLIHHPITNDRAYAEDRKSAETARQELRRDATKHGVNPRVVPIIVELPPFEEEDS